MPSSPLTSMWTQACGLIHSTFVTVPRNLTGLFASNSAPNAWWARTGAAASNKPIPAIRATSFVRIRFTSLFGYFFFAASSAAFSSARAAAQGIEHGVVALVARVFEILIAGFLRDGKCDLATVPCMSWDRRSSLRSRSCSDRCECIVPSTSGRRWWECRRRCRPIPVLLPRKLVVSMTSVLPSHRPRESPIYVQDIGTGVRTPVQRDHPRLMDHLVENHHVSARLDDLGSVAVDHRKYRTGHTARDATNVVAEVFPRGRAWIGIACALRDHQASRLGRQLWNSPVRRVDHE